MFCWDLAKGMDVSHIASFHVLLSVNQQKQMLLSLFSMSFFEVSLLVSLSFAWDECSYLVSVHPQQVWLIHIIVNEQLLNAPALGTTICGKTVVLINMTGNEILDLKNLLLLLKSERSWSSLTLNKSVRSWTKPMMTRWPLQHVRFSLASLRSKNVHCSHSTSCSTHTGWKPSRCTTCCIASASTFGIRGIDSYLLQPWTSDGKMILEIRLLSATKNTSSPTWTHTALTGLRDKNIMSSFHITFIPLRLTFSLTLCAWAAMRLFQTATCFLKLEKSPAFRVVGLSLCFFVLASLLLLTC